MIALLFIIVFALGWYFGDISRKEEVKILKEEIKHLKAKRKY